VDQLWFYEKHTRGYGVHWKVKKVLHTEKTRFQELSVIDTVEWGKTLVLDGNIQVTERDEFIYHEMIAHIAMNSHPHPQKILIIGGGDGGTAREVLKHDSVVSSSNHDDYIYPGLGTDEGITIELPKEFAKHGVQMPDMSLEAKISRKNELFELIR
jgi:hypothetical protein